MPNANASNRLNTAIATLVLDQPFAASILLRLERQEAHLGLGSMGTDGTRLLYDPAWVEQVAQAELCMALVHEAYHVLGLHPWRREWREPLAYNIAADHTVNALVQEAGYQLSDGLVPPIPNSTPEQNYEQSVKEAEEFRKQARRQLIGAVLDAEGSASERAEGEARAKEWIAEAAARQAGKLPAGLARYVKELLAPRVDWREALARFVASLSRDDYSWRRPNRRYLSRGIGLPSLWTPKPPDIMFWCDTSASVGGPMLQRMCSELIAMMRMLGANALHCGWCDTEPHTQWVTRASELKPTGGGGTMFSPAFAWTRKHKPELEAVVYATDGFCADFGERPPFEVLWLLVGDNENFRPPWGEVIRVREN